MPEADELKISDYIRTESDAFEIESCLGQGGMGVVYKARQASMNRTVAIKMLHPHLAGADQTQRLINEAKSVALLIHPNIVRVFSIGVSQNGEPFIVMEYLEGDGLDELIAQSTLSLEQFYTIFDQVISALEEAHKCGIIHRDLKPANIFITTDGVIKLLDFGIAKLVDASGTSQSTTQTGAMLGTPAFMSPEQCRAEKLDHRADIYSLGCVMFNALTGAQPFEGSNALDTMYRHLHEKPDLTRSKASKSLQIIVTRMMEKDPGARFQSVEEVRAALEASRRQPWLDSTPPTGMKLKAATLPTSNKKTLLPIIALAVACVVSVVVLAAPHLAPPTDTQPARISYTTGVEIFAQGESSGNAEEKLALRKLAATWFRRSLKQAQAVHENKYIADASLALAQTLWQVNPDNAMQPLQIAETEYPKYYGRDSHETLHMWLLVGGMLQGMQKYDESIQAYHNGFVGSDAFPLIRSEFLLKLAVTNQAAQHPAEAAAFYKQALASIQDQTSPAADLARYNALASYGLCLVALGKLEEATHHLEHGIAGLKTVKDGTNRDEEIIQYYVQLAGAYGRLHKTKEEQRTIQDAVELGAHHKFADHNLQIVYDTLKSRSLSPGP